MDAPPLTCKVRTGDRGVRRVTWARPYGKTDLGFALTRVTLSLRQLGAEPHTKEVGHVAVYNHHRFRSARRDDGRRRLVAEPSDAGAARTDVGQRHDCAVRGTGPAAGRGGLL